MVAPQHRERIILRDLEEDATLSRQPDVSSLESDAIDGAMADRSAWCFKWMNTSARSHALLPATWMLPRCALL